MKKLVVTKETLAPLTPEQSAGVAGGYVTQFCTRVSRCASNTCDCSTAWPHGLPC